MALSRMSKFVVLDIDGVLLKGGKVIDGAAASVRKLAENRIPYVFVTNGGGVKEAKKAEDLTKKLGVDVSPTQVVLSHTPLKNLSEKYANSKVLIVGGQHGVAQSYGFNKACTIHEVHAENSGIYCLREAHSAQSPSCEPDSPVEAVMVFHDPLDWGLEMQIMSDVLSPHHLQMHPQLNTEENKARGHIPLYVTNADLVYTTEYRAPRFTQGAFATAFQHLYQTHHGQPLQIEYCGKPFKVQYEYATQLLRQQHQQQQEQQQLQSGHATATGSVGEEVFFGVGDNPLSDIRGANSAGPQWRSVLVRTGVFRDRSKENDAQDPAHYVCEDIREAVDLILAYGGGGHSGASGAFDAAALS